LLAAVLIDIIVDRNRRFGGEIEGGGVAAVAAGAGVAAGAVVGAGCACANLVEPDIAPRAADAFPASIGDGIARTFVVPANIRQPRSQIANGSRCVITTGS